MPRIPAYERIRDVLRRELDGLPPRSRLPSETALAARFGVTRVTVRQALSGLALEGLVHREQGRGTFVREQPPARRSLSRLTSFSEDLGALGGEVGGRVLVSEERPAPPQIQAALKLTAQESAVHLLRVRYLRGLPVAIQEAWLPVRLFPDLAQQPLLNGSLYQTLERRYGIHLLRADEQISAVAATKEQAALLEISRRSPLLQLERKTFDERGNPIEYATSWTRPEYILTAVLVR